jgi:hypothetical protein
MYIVVNGYSDPGGGLEFSRAATSPNELKAVIRDAWNTPRVVDVVVDAQEEAT